MVPSGPRDLGLLRSDHISFCELISSFVGRFARGLYAARNNQT